MVIWSDLNQITKFQIKSKSNHTFSKSNSCSVVLQIKSLCVIQSWFKSNHDLDLPITENGVWCGNMLSL